MARHRQIARFAGPRVRNHAFALFDTIRAVKIGQPLRETVPGLGRVERRVKLRERTRAHSQFIEVDALGDSPFRQDADVSEPEAEIPSLGRQGKEIRGRRYVEQYFIAFVAEQMRFLKSDKRRAQRVRPSRQQDFRRYVGRDEHQPPQQKRLSDIR